MNNLILEKERFVYRTADYPKVDGVEVEAINVDIHYIKGRGAYCSVTPVKLSYCAASGFVGEAFMMFSGVSGFLMGMARKNAKQLAAVAAILDPLVTEAARMFAAGDQQGAVKLLVDRVAKGVAA